MFGTFLGYVWLALTDSLLALFLARAFTGAMAANIAVVHAYVADITPPEHRARGMGRIGAAHGLGFVTGPAIGGLLAGADPLNPDFQSPFIAAAGLAAAAFVIGLCMLRESVGIEAKRAAAARGGEEGAGGAAAGEMAEEEDGSSSSVSSALAGGRCSVYDGSGVPLGSFAVFGKVRTSPTLSVTV